MLPNLSHLALKTDGSLSGTPPEPQVAAEPGSAKPPLFTRALPDDGLDVQEYEELLIGDVGNNVKVPAEVATLIEAGQVLSSFRQDPFMETLPQGIAAGLRSWWMSFHAVTEMVVLGEGTYNVAAVVSGKALPPAAMFQKLYGVDTPFHGMVVRTGKAPTDKQEVVNEIITASYAQAMSIGPVVYAQFYNVSSVELLGLAAPPAWNEAVPETQIPPKGPFGDAGVFRAKVKGKRVDIQVARTFVFAEAWEGNLNTIVDPYSGMDVADVARRPFKVEPVVFANELYDLCNRAAAAGFWHMDVKRANMLYRRDRGAFEMCFTDFDSYFCIVLSPTVREQTRRCCIVATMAMVLGEMRCQLGLESWELYAPACVDALNRLGGIKLGEISPLDWCNFLRYVYNKVVIYTDPETGKRKRIEYDDLSGQYEKVANRLYDHVENYFQATKDADKEKKSRCFNFKDGRPAFAQIVQYAMDPVDVAETYRGTRKQQAT